MLANLQGWHKLMLVGDAARRTMEGMESIWAAVAWSILPTIGVSAVFFFVVRSIIRSDRTERRVHARIEAEERAARGMPPRVS